MARSGVLYRPCSLVTTDWATPVPTFLTSTVAPGIGAPEESRTTPRIVARTAWASSRAAAAIPASAQMRTYAATGLRTFMCVNTATTSSFPHQLPSSPAEPADQSVCIFSDTLSARLGFRAGCLLQLHDVLRIHRFGAAHRRFNRDTAPGRELADEWILTGQVVRDRAGRPAQHFVDDLTGPDPGALRKLPLIQDEILALHERLGEIHGVGDDADVRQVVAVP